MNQIDHTTPQAQIAARMEAARQVNATWVRCDFLWYSVEWNQGQWDWHYFDYVTQEASARGLKVIAILEGTPSWAATDGVFSFGVPNMLAWENFVAQTVARYQGVVAVWEIWNEPDTNFYWRGTPAQYAELLARASTKIEAADPTATVALGGLAQGGGGLVPDFLQQVLGDPVYPAGLYFNWHNIHTNFRTMGDIAAQISINATILGQYGLQKPIIATEASYTSDPAYQTLPGYVGGGDATQATYVVDAFSTMLGGGLVVAVWATLVDYVNGTGAYTASGLTHPDLTPKPAYLAYQAMAQGSIAAPPPPAPISNSDITVSTGRHSGTVTWTTNVPGTSTVQFGETSALGSTVSDGTLTTSHSISINQLSRDTTYYARVTSGAADGSSATSDIFIFQTW